MDRREIQYLIDNPPPKDPYFRLPSVKYLVVPPEETPEPPRQSRSRAPNTVTGLWGRANNMTEETKTSFLTDLLRFSVIDFDAMAKDKGIATGHQIKQRLNTIVSKEGYKLEGNRVVTSESPTATEEGSGDPAEQE